MKKVSYFKIIDFMIKKRVIIVVFGISALFACGSDAEPRGVAVPFEVVFEGIDSTATGEFQVQAIIQDQASLDAYLETIGNPESKSVDFSNEVVIVFTDKFVPTNCPTSLVNVEKDSSNHITINLKEPKDCVEFGAHPIGTKIMGIKVKSPVETAEVVVVNSDQ